MSHAFNIRLPDKSVHGYVQRYPFLNGPDHGLNRTLRKAVLESTIALTDEQDDNLISFLSIEEQRRIVRELSLALQIPVEMGLDQRDVDIWMRHLAWKVRTIPQDARDVLVIGSGDCKETLFIRHRLPNAKITCADFEPSKIRNIDSALKIEFRQGNFNDVLAERAEAFDVVFSNHVLEHLYNPGETLRLIKRSLRRGGRLISALPLDGQPAAPFSCALNQKAIHPLDFCTVDVGHGWKTNISNLLYELRSAGFSTMSFFGRDKHYSCFEREYSGRDAFVRRVRLGLWLNRIFFGGPRAMLKKVFPHEVPAIVLKVVFAIERRCWFGSNRLKSAFSVEVLVSAG